MRDAYRDFLTRKVKAHSPTGHVPSELPDKLFSFQEQIVRWAVLQGRACIFADTGLGKTIMQLAWAQSVVGATRGSVLILAPLAVSHQTRDEAARMGIPNVRVCKEAADVCAGINITNYERLDRFDLTTFSGVVLDESSILKSHSSKTRNHVIESFGATPYRLACTATPAPNDYMELGNHAEFVGAMSRAEMLAMFFVHDGGETQKWRLKGHAREEFWRWIATWACVIRKPSDIGYEDGAFALPELVRKVHVVGAPEVAPPGMLFAPDTKDLMARKRARKTSVDDRAEFAAALVAAEPEEQWLLWCDLNAESAALASRVPGAVEVKGADSAEHKEQSLLGFADGSVRVLVSKPSICGWGMNFQSCARMVFVGLSDSFESVYQATRRCWRFGQTRPVVAHTVIGRGEGDVLRNIERKEREAVEMAERMAGRAMNGAAAPRTGSGAKMQEDRGTGWRMIRGDCVEAVSEMDGDSAGYSVFSPPFASLYTYSDSERDMGNCLDDDEFMEHFQFLIPELLRVTQPGRLCSFHCMNIPAQKGRHGYIGLRDFRGELIRAFSDAGWIYHSEVVIWKDPVTAMQRTKALGLLHKTIRKDSSMSRQAIPDYVVTMRKPGENTRPIPHTSDEFPVSLWQKWASPVWDDINPSDTLQFRSVREDKDEKHICPLQLDVIRRCLGLWSTPGDLVLSPFAGIGSEGFQAVRHGRQFVGVELKDAYYRQACANLRAAEVDVGSSLFQEAAR